MANNKCDRIIDCPSQSMVQLLTRIDERTERLAEDVCLLKHVLIEGNGKPGVVTQVAIVAERIDAIEKSNENSSCGLSTKERFALYSSVVAALSTVLVSLFEHLR